MALLSIQNVSLAFGGPALFEDISLHVERGDRVGLLGRNGCGKSTLLRLIAGELKPDSGAVVCRQGVRIASLPQDVPADLNGTVYEEVLCGLGQAGQELLRYHRLARLVQDGRRSASCPPCWNASTRWRPPVPGRWSSWWCRFFPICTLRVKRRCPKLSGGVKRRVLLARALVGRAGYPAAGRTDKPSGYRYHRLAGKLFAPIIADLAVCHP